MKISYGKNVYGEGEIKAVLNQLKRRLKWESQLKNLRIKLRKIF